MPFFGTAQARHLDAAAKVLKDTMENEGKRQVAKEQVAFLNIIGARMWHDLHNSKTFIDLLRDKLTRKLLKVKVKIIYILLLSWPKTETKSFSFRLLSISKKSA